MTFVLALLGWWFGGFAALAATVDRVDIAPDHIAVRFDRASAAVAGVLVGESGTVVPGTSDGTDDPGNGVLLVFDLAQPALAPSGQIDADHPTLTLALRTASDAGFAAAAAKARLTSLPPFNLGGDQAVPRNAIIVTVPPPRAMHLPSVYGDDPNRPLVVIDAGHGGRDPGAVAEDTGLMEKDVTLRIAEAIKAELLRSGRVRVALTREDDRFLVLQERFGLARKLHADLFISIHCDSVGAGTASGASIYTLSEVASDKEAARLAARENKADIIAGVDLGAENAAVSSILIDLAQRETMDVAAGFADLLGREAAPLIQLRSPFHRMASLVVLKAPDLPSVLFETGYISNPVDAALINSSGGQARIAEAVRRAVEVHFARRSKPPLVAG